MHSALRPVILPLAVSVLASFPAFAEPTAEVPVPQIYERFVSDLTAEITLHRSRYDDPGIAIALAEETGTPWSTSFGVADRESGRRVDQNSIFEMGSVSKLFTCAAVLQLREKGLVDLDRPIRAYLPGFDAVSRFSAGAEAITVRMLMTHHSGLMMDDDAWETSVPVRFFYRAVFEYIKDKPLLYPPGQKMRYSSFGANLLGLLIEKVSGMDYARYMREQLLLPLDMPRSSFDFHDLPVNSLAKAYGYHPVWDLIPMEEIRPAGSLRGPVGEVAHFATMLLAGGEYRGKRLLSRESIAEMLKLQNGENCLDGDARMGLGFMMEPRFLRTGSELAIVYHFGQARTKSLFLLVPAWKKGLVVSCNDYGVTDASYDLFSKVWSRYLRAMFAAESQAYDHQLPIAEEVDPVPGRSQAFAGDYASTRGLRRLISSGGTLTSDTEDARFIPLADGTYVVEPWTFPRILYRFDERGATASVNGYPVDRWERLGNPDLPPGLSAHAGAYAPVEMLRPGLPPRIELREMAGRLVLRPVRTEANERLHASMNRSGTVFPLRFTGADSAEVVNGALSGFFGYRFVFKPGDGEKRLVLVDALGSSEYRQLP